MGLDQSFLKAYEVELQLVSNEIFQGVAKTTLSQNQQEFLVLENNKGEHKVRLDQIKIITVLTYNAVFKTIQLIEMD